MPTDPFKNAANIEELGRQLQVVGTFVQRMGCLDKAGHIMERLLQSQLLVLDTNPAGLGVLKDEGVDYVITALTPEEYNALKFLLEHKS